MQRRTRLQRLADTLLRQIGEAPNLDAYVALQRQHNLSWGEIADGLFEATGGLLEINRETLRVWYGPQREDAEVASHV